MRSLLVTFTLLISLTVILLGIGAIYYILNESYESKNGYKVLSETYEHDDKTLSLTVESIQTDEKGLIELMEKIKSDYAQKGEGKKDDKEYHSIVANVHYESKDKRPGVETARILIGYTKAGKAKLGIPSDTYYSIKTFYESDEELNEMLTEYDNKIEENKYKMKTEKEELSLLNFEEYIKNDLHASEFVKFYSLNKEPRGEKNLAVLSYYGTFETYVSDTDNNQRTSGVDESLYNSYFKDSSYTLDLFISEPTKLFIKFPDLDYVKISKSSDSKKIVLFVSREDLNAFYDINIDKLSVYDGSYENFTTEKVYGTDNEEKSLKFLTKFIEIEPRH